MVYHLSRVRIESEATRFVDWRFLEDDEGYRIKAKSLVLQCLDMFDSVFAVASNFLARIFGAILGG